MVVLLFQSCVVMLAGGEDYEPVTESVTFDPGVLSRSLLVPIVDDGVREEPEEFQVL